MGATEQTQRTPRSEHAERPASSGRGAGNRTRGENIPAIERATGREWADWLRFFEQHGANGLPHPEIARLARGDMPAELKNPDWWAQGVEKPRTSRTGKRSFWRFSLDGAGKVEVAAIDKGDGRSSVTVGHDGIPDADGIEEWRAHWKRLLSEL